MTSSDEKADAQTLVNQMKKFKNEIVSQVGQEKYDEEMKLLEKISTQEANKGKFKSIIGNVDTRDGNLTLTPLANGF